MIKSHNQQTLNEDKQLNEQPPCNCREKDKCPLQGDCLTRSVVYQGSVTDGSPNSGNYIGITEHTFKGRLYQHLNSFKYRSKGNSTEMYKHIWNLKDQGITNPYITWSILDRVKTRQNGISHTTTAVTTGGRRAPIWVAFVAILLAGEGQRFHEVKRNTTDYYPTNNRSFSFI